MSVKAETNHASSRGARRRGIAIWLFVCALLAACGDDEATARNKSITASDASSEQDGAAAPGEEEPTGPVNPCEDKYRGTSCGKDRICFRRRCVYITCGDGVKSGAEECDDGNEVVGDGCDPSCKLEPTGCGNAIREGDEECDDGNRIDLDACSNSCKKSECGNMRVDGREECDDGNNVNGDGCSNTCKRTAS